MRLLLVASRSVTWRSCLVGGLYLVATAFAQGSVVFDWPSSPGWTAGSPAAGTTASQTFTSVSPNDITAAINNNGVSASGATWQTNHPQISAAPVTGGF